MTIVYTFTGQMSILARSFVSSIASWPNLRLQLTESERINHRDRCSVQTGWTSLWVDPYPRWSRK